MRVVLTGGGTGGHIYPALAVAEELRRTGADVLYIGGVNGLEARIAAEAGFEFVGLPARKFRKVLDPTTPGVLITVLRGVRQASSILARFRPDVVIGTGGYVLPPTGIAAALRRIPIILQACDSIPGRANFWLSRAAWRICIWFEETARFFPGSKTVVTGVPLRPNTVSLEAPADARRALGLDPQRFTVTVLGGSQGARRLNQIVGEAVQVLPEDMQVLHQTGTANFEEVQSQAKAAGVDAHRHQIRAYLNAEDMARAYRAADLVVCRCGIATLAEVTANGVPGLLVPLPTAYADHQTHNALAIVQRGAGILLRESELTGSRLAAQIQDLRNAPDRLRMMAEAGRRAARPQAAQAVAELARQARRGRASA